MILDADKTLDQRLFNAPKIIEKFARNSEMRLLKDLSIFVFSETEPKFSREFNRNLSKTENQRSHFVDLY